jgi:putative nucleotidyltransferase with HDIG domain
MKMSTHSWIQKIQSLPVLPQVAMRVTERIQSSGSTLDEISRLIESDAGLTARILKLANSSYYSVPGGVKDIRKALQFLGFTTIAQVVLTSSVFGSFKNPGLRDFPLLPFWIHSLAVGQVAELTARGLNQPQPADAFIGGLLHDVGKLILLELAPDQLARIARHALEHRTSFLQAERDLGLEDHIVLGVGLARHWKLPELVEEAIRSHHSIPETRSGQIVAWANLWVHLNGIGASGSHDPETESRSLELGRILGLSPAVTGTIEQQFRKEFEKAEAILGGH